MVLKLQSELFDRGTELDNMLILTQSSSFGKKPGKVPSSLPFESHFLLPTADDLLSCGVHIGFGTILELSDAFGGSFST